MLENNIKIWLCAYGCRIIFDGWSDVRLRHIMNISAFSHLGMYFLQAMDTGKAGEGSMRGFIFSIFVKLLRT